MEAFVKVLDYIKNLDKKNFQQHLLAVLIGIVVISGGITYYIHQQSTEMLAYIKKLEEFANKSVNVLTENQKTFEEEQRLRDILEQYKNFNIKSYFEEFCKNQGINPDPSWDTRTEDLGSKFEEILLPATFKGQTTEKLVKVLAEFDKNDIISVTELEIKNDEATKKIDFTITIATKKFKKELE